MLKLSENIISEIEKAAAKYPDRNSSLMPGLWAAQHEYGYLSDEVIEAVAAAVGVPKAKALGVATYHTLYWKQKTGQNVIMLCTNVSCTLVGAETLLGYLENKLGIHEGGTTADGKFSLFEVECIGSCGSGPAMVVNETYYYDLTEQKIDEILAKY